MIEIKYDDRDAQAALARLAKQVGDLTPALRSVGEYLIRSTKQRFRSGTAPDGRHWAANSPVTLARKKGTRPLIGESRRLGNEIAYEVSAHELRLGSSLEYAAVQQLGARRGAFGKNKRNHPIPWGDIPARPFLGLSEADQHELIDILQEHLEEALR